MRSDEREKKMRGTDNTFNALVRAFKDSAKFKELAPASQALIGAELECSCRSMGSIAIDLMRPALIQEYLDGWADKPGKQYAARAAFRMLEKWAVVRDYLPRQITLGVEIVKSDGGHVPWTNAQVDIAVAHARHGLERVVILGAHTGQRRSDLIRMGPTDLEIFQGREGIRVVQQKTGREVWVPILSTLAAAMQTWERRPGPWIRRPDGRPWDGMGKELTTAWIYERDHNPELAPLKQAGLVLHGLRGHACVRLYRAGATTRQVADMVGMSEGMVARYTKKSVQRENASAAVFHLEREIDERQKRERK